MKLNSEYDIVHLHDGGGHLEAVFCGFGKAKIIYHLHGSPIREGMPNSYIQKTQICVKTTLDLLNRSDKHNIYKRFYIRLEYEGSL